MSYESQHQSQSNEKSTVQFDYEKAVSNYLGTQSTFNPLSRRVGSSEMALEKLTAEAATYPHLYYTQIIDMDA